MLILAEKLQESTTKKKLLATESCDIISHMHVLAGKTQDVPLPQKVKCDTAMDDCTLCYITYVPSCPITKLLCNVCRLDMRRASLRHCATCMSTSR